MQQRSLCCPQPIYSFVGDSTEAILVSITPFNAAARVNISSLRSGAYLLTFKAPVASSYFLDILVAGEPLKAFVKVIPGPVSASNSMLTPERSLAISNGGDATAGQELSFAVSQQDAFGNVVEEGRGMVFGRLLGNSSVVEGTLDADSDR